MDGVILLKEVDNFEEHVNGVGAPNKDYNDRIVTGEVEDIKVKLEDIHHSIDIKEDPILGYQQNSNEEIPHPTYSPVQIKKEEIEFNLEDLHHSIDIKEETLVPESLSNEENNPQTSGKKFVHKSNFIGTAKKKYSYEIYNKKYVQEEPSNIRIITCAGLKIFECKICGYKCNLKGTLKVHLSIHTGEKRFTCEICGSKFVHKGMLENHFRIHTGETPFSCGICDYKGRTKQSLKLHLVTHREEKPYACETCDYKCKSKQALKAHQRRNTFCRRSLLLKM